MEDITFNLTIKDQKFTLTKQELAELKFKLDDILEKFTKITYPSDDLKPPTVPIPLIEPYTNRPWVTYCEVRSH